MGGSRSYDRGVVEARTPGQRARAEWRGYRSAVTLVDAVVGGALGVVGVALFGSDDPVLDAAIVAGAAILSALVVPLAELGLLRLRMPGIILRENMSGV